MKAEFTVFNFSGIYDDESFYRRDKGSSFCGKIVDLRDVPGTNCLCDDFARKEIRKRILDHLRKSILGEEPAFEDKLLNNFTKGVHFIDSGNYHYMSALLLEMINEPFSLVVLDHHPDMQPSMFGDILSCGSWVKEVIDKNPYVKDVHVIGADRKLIDELDETDVGKVKFYDREDVIIRLTEKNVGIGNFKISLPQTDYPVYLSIDKDVISKEYLETNWDQGDFTDIEVLEFTRALLAEKNVIGVDICGESSYDQDGAALERAIAQNDKFNMELLELIKTEIMQGLIHN